MPDEQEDEVEKFREFLDQVSPEDFERRPTAAADRHPQPEVEGCDTAAAVVDRPSRCGPYLETVLAVTPPL